MYIIEPTESSDYVNFLIKHLMKIMQYILQIEICLLLFLKYSITHFL